MQRLPVIKIIDSSMVDGPGNRSAVFLQGCNFDCKYCHNPETIDPRGRPDTLRDMTVEEVLERIGSNAPFIRGITISGGECMLYEDFVFELCKESKCLLGQNFSCMLDSNGSVSFEKVLPVIDGVLLDIKAFDPSAHLALAGAANQTVLDQAVLLAKEKKLYEIRTVVLGGEPQAQECIKGMAGLLKKHVDAAALSLIGYKLITYRPKGVRPEFIKELKVPKESQMQQLASLALQSGFGNVEIV